MKKIAIHITKQIELDTLILDYSVKGFKYYMETQDIKRFDPEYPYFEFGDNFRNFNQDKWDFIDFEIISYNAYCMLFGIETINNKVLDIGNSRVFITKEFVDFPSFKLTGEQLAEIYNAHKLLL